jgi:zinc transporter 1/2/3
VLSTQHSETYDAGSFRAREISGILDAASAGILIYTALTELLARDFMLDKNLTRDKKTQLFMVLCFLLGCGIMSVLGKWS